jgi:hypothetical protein
MEECPGAHDLLALGNAGKRLASDLLAGDFAARDTRRDGRAARVDTDV